MTKYDYELAAVMWLASLVFAAAFPLASVLVIFTTVNLWHRRAVDYRAGEQFARRVRETLAEDLARMEVRLAASDRAIEDIKESQTKIAGAFRGRSLVA